MTSAIGLRHAPRDAGGLSALVVAGLMLAVLDGGPRAYLAVVIGLAAALLSPPAAVSGIVIAIPFTQHPVAIGGGRWSPLELAILLAIASIGPRMALPVVRARSARPAIDLLRPWSATGVAGLLLIAGAWSIANVADPRFRPDSIRELRWVIVEPVMALFAFRWAIRQGHRDVVVGAFIATGCVVAAIGLVQLVTGDGVVIADGAQRATGPYEHPNNLALYLERVAMLALGIAATTRSARRYALAASFMLFVGLAATLSRGAGLAAVAGAGAIATVARIKHGWRWIGAGALGVLLVIGLLGAQRLTDRGSAGATSSRELIWRSSIEMIRDHPITGVGLDQFLNQYGRRYVEPAGWPERYTSHPHNLVLDFWLRLGQPGLVCLAALLALCGWLIARAWRSHERTGVVVGAAGALVAGFTHGLVDNSFFLADLAVMTWLMIALLEPTTWGAVEP